MDVGRSISYVFQDPDWLKKILIGGVLFLIPIFGWFVVLGYWIRVAKQVATGRDLPLPEWNDFGGDFMLGLKAWVSVFIWAVPLLIVFGCGWIPFAALGNSSNSAASAIGGLFAALIWFVGSLCFLALAFITPVIVGRVVMSDSVSAAFKVNQIIDDARANAVPLLIIVGMTLVLRFVAGFGIVLCGVGVLFTSFLTYVMLSHLFGQFWQRLGMFTPPNQTIGYEIHPPEGQI